MDLDYTNYKLPLKPVDNGHGYYGTLAQTTDGNEVQCHICGKLVENLGNHAWQKHQIKAKEYREMFQLSRRTPLCSDAYSNRISQAWHERWGKLSTAEQEERRQSMAIARQKAVRVGNPTSLEKQNQKGLCPDQLIEKIQQLAEKLGRSPSYQDFAKEYNGKYIAPINRTFGSWNGAKHIAGYPPLKPGSLVPHNRSPYTDDQLLEFLRSFKKEHKRIPTYSDWRRGYLPSYYLYKHRFGGIEKARQKAYE